LYSFFVLGLVPGTSFQITFLVWLDLLLFSIETSCVIWFAKRYPESIIGKILILHSYIGGWIGSLVGHVILALQQSSMLEEQFFQEISAGSSD
jgi:hypothetical protein